MKKILSLLLALCPIALFAQDLGIQLPDTTGMDEARKQRIINFAKSRAEADRKEKEAKAREAAFLIGEEGVENFLADLMPLLKEELRYTISGERLLKFYESSSFKASGLKPFLLSAESMAAKERTIAAWASDIEKMKVSVLYFNNWLRDNNFTTEDLKTDVLRQKFLQCLAPVFIHESQHQQSYVLLKEKGLIAMNTLEEEYIAIGWGELFVYEKRKLDPSYGAKCGTGGVDFDRGLSLDKVYAVAENTYQSLPGALNDENVEMLIGERSSSFMADMVKRVYGETLPERIKMEDMLEFDTKQRVPATWERLSVKELQAALDGKKPLYNAYRKVYNKQIKELESAYKAAQ